MDTNTIVQADALEFLRGIPDGAVDLFFTDPPYGQLLDKWDREIEPTPFLGEMYRAAAPDSLLCFFHQLPQALDWLVAARAAGWTLIEHVVWLKRMYGRYAHGLVRTHESLFIYRKGRAKFHETRGGFADIKIPHYLDGALTAEALYSRINDLEVHVRTGKPRLRKSGQKQAVHQRSFRENMRQDITSDGEANFTNVWSFAPDSRAVGHNIAHPSVRPLELCERAIRLLTPPDALVIDPFAGSGTALVAARNTGRRYAGCDLSAEYVNLARHRLAEPYTVPMFGDDDSGTSEDAPAQLDMFGDV